MSALLPATLLLFWSALAATGLTGLVAAPLLGERFSALALAPRQPGTGHALAMALTAYPLAYSLGFAGLGSATAISGAALGCGHAALLAFLSLRQGGLPLVRANGRRALLCITYGALLGFAFLTP